MDHAQGKCALAMAVALSCGIVAAVACSEPTTLFGPPGGLGMAVLPGNGGGGDGAMPAGPDGGGAAVDASGIVCTTAVDAAGCPSWQTDIFPYVMSTGAGQCGSGACHGPGLTPPTVTDADPKATYNAFANYTTLATTPPQGPLLRPCSTDPTMSKLECLMGLNSMSCGSPMPETPGVPPDAGLAASIVSWIACGAPFN